MYAICSARSLVVKFSLVLFSLLCAPLVAVQAAVIVSFDFEDPDENFELIPEFSATGVIATPWRDLDGTVTDFAGNPGRAVAASSWNDGNSLLFTLAPLPGFALTLDGFSFDQRASASGARAWSLWIAGTEIAGGLTALTFTNVGGTISSASITGPTAITLTGSGASSGSGTWRIDNFALTGSTSAVGVSTVPLPSTTLLLLSSIFGFVGMRFVTPA